MKPRLNPTNTATADAYKAMIAAYSFTSIRAAWSLV